MLRQTIIYLVLVLMAASSIAQPVHYLHCLEVTDAGDVQFRWEKPVNANTFESYNIYFATESNPVFQLLHQSTNYEDTSYVHSPTTANQQRYFYNLMTVQTGTLDTIHSDTLSTIHLTVNNSDPYMAVLNWNPVHDPLLPGSDITYRILMHNAATSFTIVGTTTETHFEIPVSVCRDTLSFKVEIDNDQNCSSVSNVFSAVFADITAPPMPKVDSVSINPFTGETIIGWSMSAATDAGGYVVYNVLPTINDTLDFVFGRDVTEYFDPSFDPCTQNRSYALAVFDTCLNIGPGSYDIPQRTILLNEVAFDPCTMTNDLSWTPYINMVPSLQGYRVYLSIDGGDFGVHATVTASETSYRHTGLQAGHVYEYFIRAFSSGYTVTSTSCIQELTTWQYREPQQNNIVYASVEENEYVSLRLLPDTFAYVPLLRLFRSTEAAGPFELLEEIDLQGQWQLYYDDLTAEVNDQSYYYRSLLIDSCGNEVLETDLSRTVFLSGEEHDEKLNSLEWNAYEGWSSGVEKYEIYRAVNENGSFDLLAETSASELSYEDDLSSLVADYSSIYYIVRAIQHGNNQLYSQSNEIFFEYAPSIYLPNAFTPGGLNPEYKPVGAFAEFSEYRLDIYNRWGKLVFTSQDFGKGWDGIFDGNDAPVGVYVCIINYRSNSGQTETVKETFVLIR